MELLPVSVVIIRAIVLIFLFIIAIFGNFFVCFTLYNRRRYLLTPSNKLVLSLTLSNFLFSSLVFPFMITSCIKQAWLTGKVWCSLTGYISLTIVGASMFTLTAISFDRYHAIAHPLKYFSIVSNCRIMCIIGFVWLLAASVSLPPLFDLWSKYQFVNGQFGCFPAWSLNKSFSFFWILICLVLPFCVIVVSYCCIFRVAWTKTRQLCKVNIDHLSPKIACFSEDMVKISDDDDAKRTAFPCIFEDLSSTKNGNANNAFTKDVEVQCFDSGIGSSNETCRFGTLPNQVPAEDFQLFSNATRAVGEQSLNFNNNINKDCSSSQILKHTSVPNNVSSYKDLSCLNDRLQAPSDEFQMKSETLQRNASRFSNISGMSGRSVNLSHSKVPSHSKARYYGHQKKALCTILCVVGLLFVCCVPFVIVTLYDAVHGPQESSLESHHSAVDDWLLSTVTILLLFTSAYHPLIYGFWNRTVREEMKSVFCGATRGPITRRTRILSLSSHLKDLSLSPRLTAAIMLEGATVATIARPMKLDCKSIKKQVGKPVEEPNSGSVPKKLRKEQVERRPKFVCDATEVIEMSSALQDETSRTDRKSMKCDETRSASNEIYENKYRGREEMVTSTLQIDSSRLLSSNLLVPALLYTDSAACIKSSRYNLEDSASKDCTQEKTPKPTTSSIANTADLSGSVSLQTNSCASHSKTMDSMAKLTNGKLRSSNLIHLHTKPPVKIMKWNKEQTIDFFAQSFAYGLIENINSVDSNHTND